MNNCSIFSVLTVATQKSHWYPFRSLKYPLLRQDSRDTRGLWPVTMGHFSHLSPAQLPSGSKTDDSWHPLVNPEIQMGSEPLYPNGTSVHYAPVSTKALYASVGLMCQAIKSNTSSHPFPPPGRREGPSILFPGSRLQCQTRSPLARIKRGNISSSASGRLLIAVLCLQKPH